MSVKVESESHETTESFDSGKHGKDYEIEISKFAFKRLVDRNLKSFKFTREKKGLGKFDDLCYIYETEDCRKKFCLFQLKHILDETTKIGYESLAEDNNSYFLLPKYSTYYLESMKTISTDKDFAGAELEALIICTNIGFEDDLRGIQKSRVDNDELFKNCGVLYKLKISDTDKRKIFAESYLSERKKLAKELSNYIILNKEIDINCLKADDHASMLKTYHVALAKDVINVSTKCLKTEFFEVTMKENCELCKFRDSLFESVSEFCAGCKDLSSEELRKKFRIKAKNSIDLQKRLSDYESMNSVHDFLKVQTINCRCNFGDVSEFPDDDTQLPTKDININEIDSQVNLFLEKLTFALEQQSNENIIRKEMSERLFNAYDKKMNEWYHKGSYKDKPSSIRKRDWVTKEKLKSDTLEFLIDFQGKKNQLKRLVSDEDLLDPYILMHTFCSLSIDIGREIGELGDIKNYYITRNLVRQKLIDKNVLLMSKNDIFLLSHMKDEFGKESVTKFISECGTTLDNVKNITSKSRFISPESDFEDKDFDIFVNTYVEMFKGKNIHWLKYRDDDLLWERTSGSLSELQNHFSKDEASEVVSEGDVCKSNRFVILTGEPGMGKSTLVNHIAEGFARSDRVKENSKWIIKILLKDCVEILDEIECLQNLEDVVQFLSRFENVENDFSKTLLKHFIAKEDRIILILDGFDELYLEDKQDQIIEFLSFLKLSSRIKQVFVTTRPHFKNILENCLGVISYSIQEISADEQIFFLTRYWKQTSGQSEEDRILEYTEKLVKKFNNNISVQERSFLGIPLQTYMFAVVFEQEALKENPDIPASLPVTSLFEKFLVTKYQIFLLKCGEKIMKNSRKQQQQMKSYDDLHQDFALRYGGLVSLKDAERFTKSNSTEDDKLLLVDIGIIYKLNDNFYFTHKTFAEYLVAKRFVEVSLNLKKYPSDCKETLQEILLKSGNEFLLHIFDLKLTEKFSLHNSVLNGDETEVKNFSKDEINGEDCLGRRPFYYAVQYRHYNIISILIEREFVVDLEDMFAVKALILYLKEFYRLNEVSVLILRRNEKVSHHLKFGMYILKSDEIDYPQELINAYDLNLETYCKNWPLVELLVRRSSEINDLTPLQNSFRYFAPLNIVRLLLDKVLDDELVLKTFGYDGHFTFVVKYLRHWEVNEVEVFMKDYQHTMKALIDRNQFKFGLLKINLETDRYRQMQRFARGKSRHYVKLGSSLANFLKLSLNNRIDICGELNIPKTLFRMIYTHSKL